MARSARRMSWRGSARLARPLPRLGPASAPPARPLALGHGGTASRPRRGARSPRPPPPPPSRPSGWRGPARCARQRPPARPARRARRGPGSALRAAMAAHPPVVGPAPALRAAWRGGAARLPPAQPWRPELGHGAPPVRLPRRLTPAWRPACPRLGAGSANARRPAQPRPARFARVARPRRRGVACPLTSQLACGSPRDLLVAASLTRSCVRQWSAAPFAHSRSLLARTTLNHHT
jgi:hypothetical protein